MVALLSARVSPETAGVEPDRRCRRVAKGLAIDIFVFAAIELLHKKREKVPKPNRINGKEFIEINGSLVRWYFQVFAINHHQHLMVFFW